MIYIVVLFLLILINNVYRNQDENKRNKKVFCVLASIIIFLLLILRHDYVGTDTQNYRFIYDYILDDGYYVGLANADVSSDIGFYTMIYWMKK